MTCLDCGETNLQTATTCRACGASLACEKVDLSDPDLRGDNPDQNNK